MDGKFLLEITVAFLIVSVIVTLWQNLCNALYCKPKTTPASLEMRIRLDESENAEQVLKAAAFVRDTYFPAMNLVVIDEAEQKEQVEKNTRLSESIGAYYTGKQKHAQT